MNRNITFLIFVGLLFSFSIKAQVWQPVGDPSGISQASVGRLTLINDFQDNLIVGYYDGAVEAGSVQKFDGTSWSYLGEQGMTPGWATFNSTAADNQGVVYFTNQSAYPSTGLEVRKFENDAWVDLPKETEQQINYQASAFSADDVLFVLTTENSGTVKRFVDGAWEQVGTTGFFGGSSYFMDMKIVNNGTVYVSYCSNGYVHVYENNVNATTSDAWSPVGGVANLAPAATSEFYNSSLAVDANNNVYLAYVSPIEYDYRLNVKKYDGSTWTQLGDENFSDFRVQHISIAVGANEIVYVAVSKWAETDLLRNYVLAFDESNNTWSQAGTGWASVGEATFNSLAVDSQGNLFLAFSDASLNKLSVKSLNLDIIAAESVEISTVGGVPAEINVDNGTLQLVAEVIPAEANQDVIWSVEDGETFATVDQTGLVTAISSNATVTIKASAAENVSIFDTFEVNITNQVSDIMPNEVIVTTENNIYPDIFSLESTLQLFATISPAEADQYVDWSVVEGSDVLSVNQDGLVTPITGGFAIVRATSTVDNSKYDEIRVNVFENGCTQGEESMVFGQGFTMNNGVKTADDFIVDDENDFEVKTIRLSVIVEPGENITSFDLHFLKNDVDRPGEEITSVSNVDITYQKFIHDFTYYHQYEIQLDLDEGIPFSEGTYWFYPVANTSNGSSVYWDITVYGTIGNDSYSDNGDGNGWRGHSGMDCVFEITGNCTQMPIVVRPAEGEDSEIYEDESVQLVATVYAPDLSQDVIWSVESGSDFVSVDDNGVVYGLFAGVATVRATSVDDGSVYDEIDISVLDTNGCYQAVPSNGLENAYVFGDVRLAADLVVEDGYNFTITSVEPTVVNFATEFEFLFYDDAEGLPGSKLVAVSAGTITHNVTTGYNFDYYFHRYSVDLDTPVTLPEGKYWMEIITDALGWESTSADIIEKPLVFNSANTGGQWVYSSNNSEFVYKIIGLCDIETSVQDNNFSKDNNFIAYPNPADNSVSIKLNNFNNEETNVNIYDSYGHLVLSKNFFNEVELNTSNLSVGVYYLKVKTGKTIEGQKIMIK